MREGDVYPELRRMTIEPARMQETRMDADYWNNRDPRRVAEYLHNTDIPAVRVTLPEDDWARLMSIYSAHYHAALRNPAVAEAWNQYRILVALTQK